MLGFSALSENPISSVNKVLELSASMTGLAISSAAAAGTLVGSSTMSSSAIQTSAGVRILAHSASLDSSLVTSSSAVFVKGSTLETDLVSSFVQTTAGVRILIGTSTQDFNLTQTAIGELLFTEIVPSVTVTYTEITHTGDNWTEITHTGDTWTDVSTNQELQMASSYTANNGIEKIGTGEQAGTWGATTNTNFDILDRAINGVGAITLSGTTHTLTTTDGALSDGHFKVLVFGGTLSSTNTVTISPNDQDKLYFVFNNTSGSQSVIIKQGSGATVTVGNGKTAIVYADGAGSGAAVAQIETGSDEFTEDVTMKTGDGALLTLQTSATAITDGNVLGALQFQAPNESSGTDAVTVAASIVAEADNTFAADNNQTDMVFKLGSSEAATEKMRLTHEGILSIPADGSITANHFSVGTGADLKIYHDGSDSYVDDTGTGNLNLKGSIVQLLSTGGEAMIKATTDGAAELYHDGTKKIETTSAGTTVSGVVTATGFTIGSAVIAESELEQIDGITAGTVSASKAVVVDSNKDITGFRNIANTGTITAGGDITAFSDERLKSDIETIDNALNKVMNMRGVSYTKQAEKGIGVIAQEIEKVLPEVVTDGEYKSVAYGNIVGVLIEAIKDLKKELDDHKQECNCGSNKQWYYKYG